MKYALAGAVLVMLANPVFAQTTSPNPDSSSQAQQSSSSNHHLAAAQKIKDDMQKAGFTDVKVVAESFVVQAKSKDGDPVVMTVGPRGMSIFEAMNSSASTGSSATTGSSASGTNGSNSPSQQSQHPGQSK